MVSAESDSLKGCITNIIVFDAKLRVVDKVSYQAEPTSCFEDAVAFATPRFSTLDGVVFSSEKKRMLVPIEGEAKEGCANLEDRVLTENILPANVVAVLFLEHVTEDAGGAAVAVLLTCNGRERSQKGSKGESHFHGRGEDVDGCRAEQKMSGLSKSAFEKRRLMK